MSEVHKKMKHANKAINQMQGNCALLHLAQKCMPSTQLIFLSEERVLFAKMHVPLIKKIM